MVSRRRHRAVLWLIAFYAFSALAVGYFAWHAQHGDRGLIAKSSTKVRMAELNQELDALKRERADWERRVAQLRIDNLDRDLLEEHARRVLNNVHRNDVVVILPPR
jgi:cell division protein FtsB